MIWSLDYIFQTILGGPLIFTEIYIKYDFRSYWRKLWSNYDVHWTVHSTFKKRKKIVLQFKSAHKLLIAITIAVAEQVFCRFFLCIFCAFCIHSVHGRDLVVCHFFTSPYAEPAAGHLENNHNHHMQNEKMETENKFCENTIYNLFYFYRTSEINAAYTRDEVYLCWF